MNSTLESRVTRLEFQVKILEKQQELDAWTRQFLLDALHGQTTPDRQDKNSKFLQDFRKDIKKLQKGLEAIH